MRLIKHLVIVLVLSTALTAQADTTTFVFKDWFCTNADKGEFGQKTCNDFKADVIDKLQKSVGHAIWSYYNRRQIHSYSFRSGLCVAPRKSTQNIFPVNGNICETSEGSCGSPCKIEESGYDPASCVAEAGYEKGILPRIWHQQLLDYVNKINSGQFTFYTSSGGSKPCQAFTDALEQAYNGNPDMPGIKPVTQVYKDKFAKTTMPLKSKAETEACLNNSDQYKDVNGYKQDTSHRDHAFCHLVKVYADYYMIFHRAMTCDFFEKTGAQYLSTVSDSSLLQQPLANHLKGCMDRVENHGGGSTGQNEDGSWWDSRYFNRQDAVNDVNSCYQAQAVNIVKSQINSRIPVSPPVVLKNFYKGITPTGSTTPVQYPVCGSTEAAQ